MRIVLIDGALGWIDEAEVVAIVPGKTRVDGEARPAGAVIFTRCGDGGGKIRARLRPKIDGVLRELAKKRGLNPAHPKIRDGLLPAAEMIAWRVLHDDLKARLVAVRYGVRDFVQAFLAELVAEGHAETLGDIASREIGNGRGIGRLLPPASGE